jgi:putative glycosyltransferase (TIGR04348 family)
MKIILITPAAKQSRAGNRTTAVRWALILRELGHRVLVETTYTHEDADLMVALHAWRSAASVAQFRKLHPGRPLVVALTGTDIYRFQQSHPEETRASMAVADALVCLHDLVGAAIPATLAAKLHVIHQSAHPLPRPRRPGTRHFDVLVAGHLREEKDSLRAAYAARYLPENSRIRVVHLGQAHSEDWAVAAREEMARNPHYRWRGEVPGWAVRRAFGRASLMVLSSVMEGGANVISEAAVAGLPVIASEIHGTVGLLGPDYPGYYPVKDTAALTACLLRAEREPGYLRALERSVRARAALFTPERERAGWVRVLKSLGLS